MYSSNRICTFSFLFEGDILIKAMQGHAELQQVDMSFTGILPAVTEVVVPRDRWLVLVLRTVVVADV